ncbi:MAG: M15 family peptidase, partial [Pseudodesulfovibrio sp.]
MRKIFFTAVALLLALPTGCAPAIIDSRLTADEAIRAHQPPGVPPGVLARLVVVNVRHHAPDGRLHQGQIVVNAAVADEVRAAFEVIRLTRYP